jgi:hypothetical protein
MRVARGATRVRPPRSRLQEPSWREVDRLRAREGRRRVWAAAGLLDDRPGTKVLHDLRARAATFMVEAGASTETLRTNLGWKSRDVVERSSRCSGDSRTAGPGSFQSCVRTHPGLDATRCPPAPGRLRATFSALGWRAGGSFRRLRRLAPVVGRNLPDRGQAARRDGHLGRSLPVSEGPPRVAPACWGEFSPPSPAGSCGRA